MAGSDYHPTPFMRFVCASSAACTAELVTYPLEALIIRLQVQKGYQHGMGSMASSVVRSEGLRALWGGACPALCRQVVTGGIGVGWYPIVRRFVCGEADPQLWQRVLSGSVSGMVAQFFASPLDVVKVRLQMQAKGKTATAYTGMLDAFRVIWKKEGVPGYFRGVTPSLFRAGAQYGAGTATYDHTKNILLHRFGQPDTTRTHIACSAISGFATAVAGCPGDVIKTRMITQILFESDIKYRNTFDCAVQTVKEDGLRGLYKGFLPTWMRLAPWQIVFFVAYEKVSLLLTGRTFQTK